MRILLEQVDELRTVDRSDDAAVDAACKVANAVNGTAANIAKLADLSMKAAMLRSGATGTVETPGFFLEGGE